VFTGNRARATKFALMENSRSQFRVRALGDLGDAPLYCSWSRLSEIVGAKTYTVTESIRGDLSYARLDAGVLDNLVVSTRPDFAATHESTGWTAEVAKEIWARADACVLIQSPNSDKSAAVAVRRNSPDSNWRFLQIVTAVGMGKNFEIVSGFLLMREHAGEEAAFNPLLALRTFLDRYGEGIRGGPMGHRKHLIVERASLQPRRPECSTS
jgi:hypothetical protein